MMTSSTEMISGNYYSALGVQPTLGRAINESDDGEPGTGPVIVISDRYWRSHLNADPSVIGKTLRINRARDFGCAAAINHCADADAVEADDAIAFADQFGHRRIPLRTKFRFGGK